MFTDEDVEQCRAAWRAWSGASDVMDPERQRMRAAMTRAVELVAARGGALAAAALARELERLTSTGAGERAIARFKVAGHVAAQGANLVLLQSALNDVAEAVLGERPVGAVPRTTVVTVRALKAEKEGAILVAQRIQAKHTALLDILLPYAKGEEGNADVVGRMRRLLSELRHATDCLDVERIARHNAQTEVDRLRQTGDAASLHQSDQERLYWKAEHAKLLGERDVASARAIREEHQGACTTPERSIAAGCVHASHTATLFGAQAQLGDDTPTQIARREGFNEGAEAMRAACWGAVEPVLRANVGARPGDPLYDDARAAVEGAAP